MPNHSTKKPLKVVGTAKSNKQKREMQDEILEKAISLMANPPDVFGRFIANEIRAIKDPQAK